ncbi:hypothetical protein C8R41DRAFT_905025 [Lentinula lateritia]|uniref:Uncharacterized protein n=1 Tax=Lentinula lateritia TaxID=40482 RepID=A0ABQ8V5C6_9AGAR|nr:hypothetical protein C8R41DRAFT_905025 [Lentinula lateritia]
MDSVNGSRRSLPEFKQLLLPVALLRITSSLGHPPDFDALLADIYFSLNTTTIQPSFQVSCDILFLRKDIGAICYIGRKSRAYVWLSMGGCIWSDHDGNWDVGAEKLTIEDNRSSRFRSIRVRRALTITQVRAAGCRLDCSQSTGEPSVKDTL